MSKPFSQACENNKHVIGEVLTPLFDNVSTVVEEDRRDKPILNYTTTGANPNDHAMVNK